MRMLGVEDEVGDMVILAVRSRCGPGAGAGAGARHHQGHWGS